MRTIFNPFLIPVACFAMVALIVAITQLVKIRDKEIELEIVRVRQGN
jgi:hypothetical protein